MPRVRYNRTAGARRQMTYVGVSQQRPGNPLGKRPSKRARREKRALLREAHELAELRGDQVDWKAASERLRLLHRRWQAAGSAGEEQDQKWWKNFKKSSERFRRNCDEYHARLKRRMDAERKKSADLKQQLLLEAQNLGTATDHRAASKQFSDLMIRWCEAGGAGNQEEQLWQSFVAARQTMYEATAEDRRSRQAEYVRAIEERIQDHRQTNGKLRALQRELLLRRRAIQPGWVGLEMIEQLDERIADIDQALEKHRQWLEQDVERLARARERQAS
jgi:hypothetical protein